MTAVFSFSLGDLVAGLTDDNQWEWVGHCKAEIGGESSLNRLNAELTVQPISECHKHLLDLYVLAKFQNQPAALELRQELSTAQTDGTADAVVISAPFKDEPEQLLGITIGLRPQKYELFRTFVTLHFGRSDLIGRITCGFFWFVEPSRPGLRIPTKNEFLVRIWLSKISPLYSPPSRYLDLRCSRRTRRGGSRRISPSCQSYFAKTKAATALNGRFPPPWSIFR
jgi:hypothetical protein